MQVTQEDSGSLPNRLTHTPLPLAGEGPGVRASGLTIPPTTPILPATGADPAGFSREVPVSTRTPFPPVFWVANIIEVLERFAYYGIYFGFGIYMTQPGLLARSARHRPEHLPAPVLLDADHLGDVRRPLRLQEDADRRPTWPICRRSCSCMFTKSFSGIALTMLSIGLAAGIFKPLIAGHRARRPPTPTNKTLGFGIFYAMVNIGGSFGPIVAGKLRADLVELRLPGRRDRDRRDAR